MSNKTTDKAQSSGPEDGKQAYRRELERYLGWSNETTDSQNSVPDEHPKPPQLDNVSGGQ